jgi:hypothetical protein
MLVRGALRAVLVLFRGLARLVVMLVRGLARVAMFILRIPLVSLRLAGRGTVGVARGFAFGAAAVCVPLAALAWGTVRSVAAGISAVARGIAAAAAFLGRLAGRGVAALLIGVFATVRSLAKGTLACVRGIATALVWTILLPFRALRVVAIAAARGVRTVALAVAGALGTVAAGLAALAGGVATAVLVAGRGIARATKLAGGVLLTREPQRAALLPLAALAPLGAVEMFVSGFPFATVGLLLLAAFAALVLMSGSATMGGVLLAWALAVACGWRAERVTPDSPVWVDALIYVASLLALRSAYVAVRTFATDAGVAPRALEQERAHRRASRAIGLALVAQCVACAAWSLNSGIETAVVLGELLLVGMGVALAWVVRTGHYVRTAQAALTVGSVGAIVAAIAAQFGAFAKGQVFTAASLGAGLLVLLTAGALVVVVHTRLVDSEHGA